MKALQHAAPIFVHASKVGQKRSFSLPLNDHGYFHDASSHPPSSRQLYFIVSPGGPVYPAKERLPLENYGYIVTKYQLWKAWASSPCICTYAHIIPLSYADFQIMIAGSGHAGQERQEHGCPGYKRNATQAKDDITFTDQCSYASISSPAIS
jgi:hypothetical protein